MDFRKMTACTNRGGRGWNETSHRSRAGQVRPTGSMNGRRFNRMIGFWLGGILFAAGGCNFGATRPYEHPVSVAVSALWWSIYFGCFGMSVGALLGLWAEKTLGCPFRQSEGAGKSASVRITPTSQVAAAFPSGGAGRPWASRPTPPVLRWPHRR